MRIGGTDEENGIDERGEVRRVRTSVKLMTRISLMSWMLFGGNVLANFGAHKVIQLFGRKL